MSVTRRNEVRCSALRKDGQPCQAFAIRDGLCIGHQPDAHLAHAKGGAATSSAERAARALPSMLRQVSSILLNAMAKVAMKEYTPAQGTAMATLANALVNVYHAGEQDERLRQLEQMASDEGRFRDARGRERRPMQWQRTMAE